MNFFNLDLHIAVIADVQWFFKQLGHNVTNWSISGHEWVFGREPRQVDIVNQASWKNIDREMCDAFYARYKNELDKFDGFIVTHTPCFAMLYERWNKPVIVVASTRYEHPFSDNPIKWAEFNGYLREKIDAGLIVPLANNKYDAAYAEYFTQRKWAVIPSYCAYTETKYTGNNDNYLYASLFKTKLPSGVIDKDRIASAKLLPRILQKVAGSKVKRGYSWADIADYRGIVHIPYNASVMSIFEQYAANVPLFFPSFEFMRELHENYFSHGVLSQLSFNQVDGLPPKSAIPADEKDPNNFENTNSMMEWMKLADFYDEENMPHITYFASLNQLGEVLTTAAPMATSQKMRIHNSQRESSILSAWNSVLRQLNS